MDNNKNVSINNNAGTVGPIMIRKTTFNQSVYMLSFMFTEQIVTYV